MDLTTAAITSNVDSKSRAGFGPRLRSYLSSGNLFSLVHALESEQKADEEATWPDLDPVFDETTTTSNPKLDLWISALRYRLWMHGDIPLGTNYNAPLLRMTEQCIKVSKENKRLKVELRELNLKNQALLRTRPRPSNSLHRPSNSVPGPVSPLWTDSRSCATAKHRSVSFSDQNITPSVKSRSQNDTEPTTAVAREGLDTAMKEVQSSHETTGINSERDCDQLPFLSIESWPTSMDSKDHPTMINEGLQESSSNLGLPTSESFRHSISCQDLQSTIELEEIQAADHRRRKSSASVHLSRRAFSFYPGDDDVLGSLAKYSKQQRHAVDSLSSSPIPRSVEVDPGTKNEDDRMQNHESVSVARDGSTSSVVTVIKASKRKKIETKAVAGKIAVPPDHVNPRSISQRDKSADKAQGPLAAALAATARFGKSAKKTIRTVPPDF